MKTNYRMDISYDGSRYSGWQKNKNAKDTIQEKINEILTRYFDQKVEVIGAGRTDKGVHAKQMTVNFYLKHKCRSDEALIELNQFLPADIAVNRLVEVPEKFHARFDAKQKTYRYVFYKGYLGFKPVFERGYQSELKAPLDLERIDAGIQKMVGTHDFKGFSSDKTKKSTVRTIYDIQVKDEESHLTLDFIGDGFLYHMVRILVGTLVEIGQGEMNSEEIDTIFKTNKRSKAGHMAEAKGLMLMDIVY